MSISLAILIQQPHVRLFSRSTLPSRYICARGAVMEDPQK